MKYWQISVMVFKRSGKLYAQELTDLKENHRQLRGLDLKDLIKANSPAVKEYSPVMSGFGSPDFAYVVDVHYPDEVQDFCTFLIHCNPEEV
jgi:hypothetical protein